VSYEEKHIYGVSAVGTGLTLVLFLFSYAWAGIFNLGDQAGIDFFAFIFIASLVGIMSLRTLQIGYMGAEEKATYIMFGFLASAVLSIIFGAFTSIYAVSIVFSAILAAIAEEFFTRGFLYPFFTRFFNPAMGLLFSNTIWTVLHYVVYGSQPLALMYVFLNGIIMTAVMEKTQSLDGPILIHLANNLLVSLLTVGVL